VIVGFGMIKLIVTDLDNTLLRSDKTISRYTASVLEKCRKKGIMIAYATARSKQSASRFIDMFTPDIFIGYGGAAAFAGDKLICRFAIPADVSARLIGRCLMEPAISGVYAISETVAHASRLDLTDDADIPHYRIVDFSQCSDISYLKVSLVSSDQCAVENIMSEFPTLSFLRYTGEDLYSIGGRDVSKWKAVRAVAEYYGIDTAMIAAFGDDMNDLEMIRNCGIGVAVSNAVKGIRKAARHICGSNDEDGVAKWIEEHILAE